MSAEYEHDCICTYCGCMKDLMDFQIPVTFDADTQWEQRVVTYSTVCSSCRSLLYHQKMRRVRSYR